MNKAQKYKKKSIFWNELSSHQDFSGNPCFFLQIRQSDCHEINKFLLFKDTSQETCTNCALPLFLCHG